MEDTLQAIEETLVELTEAIRDLVEELRFRRWREVERREESGQAELFDS